MIFMHPAMLPLGPLMALDPGTRTIGVAACNSDRTLVSAVETIERTKFSEDAKRLFKLYDERACKGMIIGLPLHMDGGDGRRAQSARSLATNLLRLRDLPMAYQDERLSTFEAGETLSEAGIPIHRHKEMIDAQAAAIILEDALLRIAEGIPQE